jgi:glycine betaine/proline transport system ATP-binding protein
MSELEIECRHVWKIFGDRAQEAMDAVKREGLSKTEVLEHYQCVIGVADATFAVSRG